MFDIGWSEMAVVAFLALIIIGPRDLPRVLRTAGKWMRKAQGLAREFQSGLDDMVREADLEDAKKLVDKGRSLNVNKILEDTVDPTGGVRKEAESLRSEMRDDKPTGKPTVKPADEPPADGEEAPKATIVRHPLRVAPSDSITPPTKPEPKPKSKPRAKPKAEPKAKPKVESKPKPAPKAKPKPKRKPKPVAGAVAAAPGQDGSQKTA